MQRGIGNVSKLYSLIQGSKLRYRFSRYRMFTVTMLDRTMTMSARMSVTVAHFTDRCLTAMVVNAIRVGGTITI